MKRTQIYLDPAQHDFLENLAFLWSKRDGKKISLSEVIRSAIELLKEKVGTRRAESETEAILTSPAGNMPSMSERSSTVTLSG